MSLEVWKTFFEYGGVILLFLTFVFGAGALITTRRINELQAEKLREFDRELTGAKTQLGKQQEATADAERQSAEAKERAESERIARIRLEQQIAARRLSGTQKETLIKLLAPHPDSVAIVSTMLDGEGSDLADDFDAALGAARWHTMRIRNHISSGFGVSIGTVAGTVLPGTKRLADGLTAIGVRHRTVNFKEGDASTSPPFQSGVIYLVIERRPEPTVEQSTH